MKRIILLSVVLVFTLKVLGQVTDTSDEVGIGNTNPSQKLNVQGNVVGFPATSGTNQTYGIYRIESTQTGSVLDFGVNGGSNTSGWIQATYRSDLSNSKNLLLNPVGGNVGIGTTSPNYTLDIDKGNLTTVNARLKGNAPSITYTVHRESGSAAAIKAMNLSFDNGSNEVNLVNIGMLARNNIGSIPTLDYLYIGKDYNDNALRIYPDKRVYFDGNTGIGTTGPLTKLHIEGNGGVPAADYETLKANSSIMLSSTIGLATNTKLYAGIGGSTYTWLQAFNNYSGYAQDIVLNPVGGKIGIGTTSPGANLEVRNNTNSYGERLLYIAQNPDIEATYNTAWIRGETSDVTLKIDNYGTGHGLVVNTGNVGIGTTNPTYKLSVNGTIGAKEVIVTNDGWADFVFEDDYNLMSLKELDSYIKENKHLPEIPTTKEVQKNGISVGEMNAKLLQKIEELTLYIIELNKENEEQKQINSYLKSEIEELKKLIK